MKNVKNKQLQSKLNKLGIKDVILNFDQGTCLIWSEDDYTDEILSHANNYIYVYKFNDMTVDEWVSEIERIFDEAMENFETSKQNQKAFNGTIKLS